MSLISNFAPKNPKRGEKGGKKLRVTKEIHETNEDKGKQSL